MGGKASIVLVIGFALVFSYINLRLLSISSNSIFHVVGYHQSSLSRNAANAGVNMGLAKLASNPYCYRSNPVLINTTYNSGPFKGIKFYVRMDSIPGKESYLRLRSVSACTTSAKLNNSPVVLNDTVEIWFKCTYEKKFSTYGWLSVIEGNIFFITGDTLWGKVHTNGNIHISGSPVFMNKVTVSGKFDPAISSKWKKTDNKAIFMEGYEEGVPEKPFPNDMSEVKNNAVNVDSTRNMELFVELDPGATGNNNGFATVRKGSFAGPIVDRIQLSDDVGKVIYSQKTVHVKGVLDGMLSIGTEENIKIEGNIRYENPPDPRKDKSDPVNQTKDILGLVANKDVMISKDYHGNIDIHACIFARTGSFTAENYQNRPEEGRINLIGSITQYTRGVVGTFDNNDLKSGFYKSYRYDPRLSDEGENPDYLYPPSYPGFVIPGPRKVANWWESSRIPFDVNEYE